MIGGSPLGSRAIADVARRELASEWGGPEPAAPQTKMREERGAPRRVTLRKP